MNFYKEELKTLLPILIALENGQTVEYRTVLRRDWTILSHDIDSVYNLGIFNTEFRIKPEQKLVPFTFEDAEFLIGKVIVSKDKALYHTISRVSMSEETSDSKVNRGYQNLFESFNFLDGSPCGKYINK